MIKENSLLKIFILSAFIMLYNASAAFSGDEVKNDTTTYKNGQADKETTFGYAAGGSNGKSSGGSASASADASKTNPAEADATAKADEEAKKEAEDVKYSNLYHDRPLFPQKMMMYCKVNAEDIAKDLSKIEECIKKYVKAMNNDNSAIREQGLKDYDEMRYQALNDTLTVATDKLKSVINYNETQNAYSTATAKSNTQRDTEGALTNAHAFATDIINNLRELYAENLKYMAIDAIRDIDPSAILSDVEYATSKTAVKGSASTETDSGVISNETSITPEATDASAEDNAEKDEAEESNEEGQIGTSEEGDYGDEGTVAGTFLGSNQCEINGKTGVCSDGVYRAKTGETYECYEGACDLVEENGGTVLKEVIVNGSSKIDAYEKMSAEDFAAHQDEVEQLRQDLTAAMNAPDATDKEISNAQKALDRLAEVEQAKKKEQQDSRNENYLTTAKGMSQETFVEAYNRYSSLINDPDTAASIKEDAQYYLDILNQAASSVFSGQACAQVKRDYGLSVSCNDWN